MNPIHKYLYRMGPYRSQDLRADPFFFTFEGLRCCSHLQEEM